MITCTCIIIIIVIALLAAIGANTVNSCIHCSLVSVSGQPDCDNNHPTNWIRSALFNPLETKQ